MKRFYACFIGAFLIFTSLVLADTPNTIYHPYFVKTTPDPVMPGQTARIEITLQNMGTQTFYNISTQLEPTWPFTGNKTTGFIGELMPGQTATVVYYLNVDKNAEAGQYTLIHKITYYYGEWNDAKEKTEYFKTETTRTIGINVKNKERVEVEDVKYPPQVMAGEQGVVEVVLKNTGNVPVNNIEVRVNSATPQLSPLAPTNTEIDTLNPGEEKVVRFNFRSADLAPSGTYTMTLTVSYGNTKYDIPISISILGYPGIEVSRVSFTKQPEPGKTTMINICLSNMGAALQNFYVALSPIGAMNNADIAQTQAQKQNNPGIVVLGGNVKFIESILPGGSKCINFTITVSDDVTEGPRYLYLKLFGGNFQETTIPIGLDVEGAPHLSISDVGYSVDYPVAGVPLKVSVQFENSGTGKAKSVVITYKNDTSYLGTIDPGDTGTAVFRLVFDKPGRHTLVLEAEYTDKNGNKHKQEYHITIEVGERRNGLLFWGSILVVVLIAGVLGYKVRQK